MTLIYFLLGSAGLCLVSFLALFKKLGGTTNPFYNHDVLYLISISLCLIITKLCFFNAGLMNLDESIMLSGGRTLASDFRPWISVDPTTSGPLNFLPAMLLLRLADSASYGELRILYALAFQIPAICIFFVTIRRVSDAFMARLLIIPLVLTLGFFYYHDLVHASSEHMPMFFMACVFSIMILIRYNLVKGWHLVIAGILCALSFYTKLQATPVFFFLAAFSFSFLYFEKKQRQHAILLATCFILTNLAILFLISIYGGFDDFVQSYLIGNFKYAANIPLAFTPALDFIKHSTIGLLPLLAMGTLVAFVLIRNRQIKQFQHTDRLFFPGLICTLLVAGYCVAKPGRFFLHYSILLVIPVYGLLAWLAVGSGWQPLRRQLYLFGIAIFILWGFDAFKASKVIREWNNLRVVNNGVVQQLLAARQSTDRMAVWGWGSPYNHASRMLMGTRDVHFDFQVSYTGRMGKYYRDRFLSDLNTNNPEWFLDISLPGRPDVPKAHTLRHFTQIQQFVSKNYSEVYRADAEVLYRHK